jgi:hypothetical protein
MGNLTKNGSRSTVRIRKHCQAIVSSAVINQCRSFQYATNFSKSGSDQPLMAEKFLLNGGAWCAK